MTGDLINGLFEAVGGLMILRHCQVLHADKHVAGVSLLPLLFFLGWGFWNLWYYPSLDQWWSLAGGAVVVVSNSIWVGMILYYRRRGTCR